MEGKETDHSGWHLYLIIKMQSLLVRDPMLLGCLVPGEAGAL
jgi:hypothetical protein